MPFKNRIRLPIKLTRPQYTEERQSYRRADGVVKTQSVVVRKVYEGETDWMPDKWHERLKIALAHDTTSIEGEKYFGNVSQDGDYSIAWQEKFDYPTAKASFKAEVTPFNATNSNCQTCEEATQINLVDDTYPEPLDEGTSNDLNVIANDNICCYPVEFSIRYYNVDFVASAVISPEGIVTIVLKTPTQSANGLKLATYRATCANGGYDEADIFADITGSEVGCLAPLNLDITEVTPTGATFTWDLPTPAPADGYYYKLYEASNLGTPVYEGLVGGPPLTFSPLLMPGTDYVLFVAGQCGDGDFSNDAEFDFTTSAEDAGSCGQYNVLYADGAHAEIDVTVRFFNCAGDDVTLPLVNGHPRLICMLQSAPGTPTMLIIDSSPETQSYNYVDLCA